jgi:hypothetical protein
MADSVTTYSASILTQAEQEVVQKFTLCKRRAGMGRLCDKEWWVFQVRGKLRGLAVGCWDRLTWRYALTIFLSKACGRMYANGSCILHLQAVSLDRANDRECAWSGRQYSETARQVATVCAGPSTI